MAAKACSADSVSRSMVTPALLSDRRYGVESE